jgi:hypothetical protein
VFHFSLFPTVAGTGKGLFEDVETDDLKLEHAGTKTFGNGVVALTYVRK